MAKPTQKTPPKLLVTPKEIIGYNKSSRLLSGIVRHRVMVEYSEDQIPREKPAEERIT